MKVNFREDTAATLELYVPEKSAVTSGTVALYRSTGEEIQAAAALTADTTSATCANTASQGASSLVLANTDVTGTFVAGRKYVLKEAGQSWEFTCKSASAGVSNTTLYFTQRLPFAVTTDSTIESHRISYALTATHTEERDENYYATWVYVVDSDTKYATQTFDVVASVEWYSTTWDYVRGTYTWIDDIGLDDDDLDAYNMLRSAWTNRVVPALAVKGIDIARVRDIDQLRPLHAALVSETVAQNEAMRDPQKVEAYDIAQQNSANVLEMLIAATSWYDEDDDLVAERTEEEHLVQYRLRR